MSEPVQIVVSWIKMEVTMFFDSKFFISPKPNPGLGVRVRLRLGLRLELE